MHKFLKLGLLPVVFIACSNLLSCNAFKKEVALITDVGDIDDGSFNQASWEAIKEYCTNNEHPHSYDYYRPFADSDYARRCAIKQAAFKGAQVIVCPGYKFAATVSACQKEFSDVHFVLLDTDTNINGSKVKIEKNTVCVCFKAEVSGYLAGYAVATDYMRSDFAAHNIRNNYIYGFCGGMQSIGVYPYGFGFIQGLTAATKHFHESTGIDAPTVTVKYYYANVYAQSDPATAHMKEWYSDEKEPVKAVFACGGKLYQSITEAVKDFNRKKNYYDFAEGNAPRDAARWIGVDSDQYAGLKEEHEKKTIITSALKGLNTAIQTALDYHYLGVWETAIGGAATTDKGEELEREWTLGINSRFGRDDGSGRYEIKAKDYVGIPTITKDGSNDEKSVLRGFSNFTLGDYNQLVENIHKLGAEVPIYNGNCNDLYADSECKRKLQIVPGDPKFMTRGSDCYVLDSAGPQLFRNVYLSGYQNLVIGG